MTSSTIFDRHILSLCLIAILFVFFDSSIALAQTETEAERIARLEEGYEYLATKEDIARLETQVLTLRAELESAKWFVALFVAVAALVSPVIVRGLSNWTERK